MNKHKGLFGGPLSKIKQKQFAITPKESTYHIFDNGGGYAEVVSNKFPLMAEGAVCKVNNSWYIKFRNGLTPINFCDVPAEAKATMLLLQLSI